MMKMKLVFASLLLVATVLGSSLQTTMAAGSSNAQYEACAGRFHCANFRDLEYPFWGGDRAAYCGHPAFQLDCRGDVPLIALQSRPYRVLAIDTRSLVITVGREDLWNTICPSHIYNTDLDYRIFRHPLHYENLTLLYSCEPLLVEEVAYTFDCKVNQTNYFLTETALRANNLAESTCTDSIHVPINQTSAQSLTLPTSSKDDLKKVLKSGFGLIWEAYDTTCNQCARSGGRCGYYSNTSSFVCYCFDRPYQYQCNVADSGKTLDKRWGLKFIVGCVAAGVMLLFQ